MNGKTPPVRFEPLRPANRAGRAVVLISGPIIWLAALVVLAVVVNRANVVGIALLILIATLLVSVALLVPSRRRAIRDREEP